MKRDCALPSCYTIPRICCTEGRNTTCNLNFLYPQLCFFVRRGKIHSAPWKVDKLCVTMPVMGRLRLFGLKACLYPRSTCVRPWFQSLQMGPKTCFWNIFIAASLFAFCTTMHQQNFQNVFRENTQLQYESMLYNCGLKYLILNWKNCFRWRCRLTWFEA